MDGKLQHGGSRKKAGRKPVDDPKIPITFYVRKKSIWPFGNEEKLKVAVYDFIENYTKPDYGKGDIPLPADYMSITDVKAVNAQGQQVNLRDLTQPTHEIKPIEQPKTNYAVNTVPPAQPLVLTPMDAYKEEIKATTWSGDLEKVMKRLKADLLPGWQKKQLEAFAKEHAKEFTN